MHRNKLEFPAEYVYSVRDTRTVKIGECLLMCPK